jgi:hypothetical protein
MRAAMAGQLVDLVEAEQNVRCEQIMAQALGR